MEPGIERLQFSDAAWVLPCESIAASFSITEKHVTPRLRTGGRNPRLPELPGHEADATGVEAESVADADRVSPQPVQVRVAPPSRLRARPDRDAQAGSAAATRSQPSRCRCCDSSSAETRPMARDERSEGSAGRAPPSAYLPSSEGVGSPAESSRRSPQLSPHALVRHFGGSDLRVRSAVESCGRQAGETELPKSCADGRAVPARDRPERPHEGRGVAPWIPWAPGRR